MQFYLEIITCDPSNYTLDHPKIIVSNQKEEPIRAYRLLACNLLAEWKAVWIVINWLLGSTLFPRQLGFISRTGMVILRILRISAGNLDEGKSLIFLQELTTYIISTHTIQSDQ